MFFICQLSFIRIKIIFFFIRSRKKKKVLCADPILHRHLLVIKKPKRNREREETIFSKLVEVFFFVFLFHLAFFMRKNPNDYLIQAMGRTRNAFSIYFATF